MLVGFLTTLFVFMLLILILLILIQKGKSSAGLGGFGGGAQVLFGATGGQDVFQKATWVLVAIFLFGSLALSIYKTRTFRSSQAIEQSQRNPVHVPTPE